MMRSATQVLADKRSPRPKLAVIRLSAALELGAEMVQASKHQCCRKNCVAECGGCLLKMAGAGAGISAPYQSGYSAILERWPWTARSVAFPCDCHLPALPVTLVLGHLFDEHMLDGGPWPLARIVRWVEKMEVAER